MPRFSASQNLDNPLFSSGPCDPTRNPYLLPTWAGTRRFSLTPPKSKLKSRLTLATSQLSEKQMEEIVSASVQCS